MRKIYKNKKQYRLKKYNYSNNGYYFITICTHQRIEYFGNINNNKMELNWCGNIANENLIKTFKTFNNFYLNQYIIMPNHIHLIVEINDSKFNIENNILNFEQDNSKNCPVPTNNNKNKFGHIQKRSISTLIQTFKSNTTKRIDKIKLNYFKWQPRFHDHIIRNEKDYIKHIIYIENNVKNYKNNNEIDLFLK
ncbi:hypothetical protein EOM09_05360 [bacterium]|nr:hypothetical protein [bacterium]